MPQFSKKSAERVVEATRRTERTPRTRPKAPRTPRGVLPTCYALVTEAIGSADREANRLGKGKVKLARLAYDSADVCTYTTFDEEYPAYSGAASEVSAGRLVIVDFIAARLHVIVDFCDG